MERKEAGRFKAVVTARETANPAAQRVVRAGR